MTKITTAIVPVAGLGTRLLPTTKAVPKELLPLGGLPTLHYIADELAQVGVEKIILVSSESKSQIARYFEPDEALANSLREKNKSEILKTFWSESDHSDIEFEIVIQHEQLGLGHAVLCAEQAAAGQPVIVALGDCVMGLGGQSKILANMVQAFHEQSSDIVIAFEPVPKEKVSRYGIASPADPANVASVFPLADLVEKPTIEQAPSNLAVAARYILAPTIFEWLKKIPKGKDGELQLTDAMRAMIANGSPAFGVRFPDGDQRYDVGNIESYTDAFIKFALSHPTLRDVALNAFSQANTQSNDS